MLIESQAAGELRALVVDDSVDEATSLSYVLQLLGCKTAVAFGGSMALRVAELFQPTIVFLDLQMPGADGVAVLAQARSLGGPIGRALFVCLTGRSDDTTEQRCMDAGFDRFVTKPMEASALHEILLEARQRAGKAGERQRPLGDPT